MEYFDAHAHYTDEKFDEDRYEIVQDLYNAGVTKCISAGYNIQGSKMGIELSNKYEFIYTTVGISPNDVTDNWEKDIIELDNILKENHKKVVAVGEIGLDYHYDIDKGIQRQAFIKQIELANKYNLPIVIHTRDAVMDTLTIIKEHVVNKKGMFHCCPFNRELVKEALKLDYYISISGIVTFKNAKNAEEIINMIPLDKLLIETDSPFLSPEPVRGKRNDSRNLKYIVDKIAEFKNLTSEEIANITYENAKRLYSIK